VLFCLNTILSAGGKSQTDKQVKKNKGIKPTITA